MRDRPGRAVHITDAAAATALSIVLIFFCLSALFQLFHLAVFSPDWYRPLIVTFVLLFGLSTLISGIALVEHFTASAISMVATPLFFTLALLAPPRLHIALAGGWLVTNTVVGALAYRHRAGSGASASPMRHVILGHIILGLAFLPVTVVQGKLVSVAALIVGVAVGLYFLVACVLKMPSSLGLAAAKTGPPSGPAKTADR